MPKYVCLDSHVLPGADFGIETKILEEHGYECVIAQCKTAEDIVAVAHDADAVGLVYSKIDADILPRLTKCKVLVRYGIGYDSIDLEAASRQGIAVCNLPDYCQPDVATHALALILDCCRKVTFLDRDMRKGNWAAGAGYPVNRLSTLTLGLLGFGAIARHLHNYLKPYGMAAVAHDPFAPEAFVREQGAEPVTVDELWARADIISVHCPLTGETRHMINRESIAKMKDGVIIVNTARGPIICLDDLVVGLKNGKVKAAGLDTMEGEPSPDIAHPVFSLDNVVLTPHSAFSSVEAEIEQHQKVAKSVLDVLGGGELPYNVVNKKQLVDKKEVFS